ncbi:MAG: cyclophilin-like fold protein [Propionibacteriaceae bacterium]
MIIGGQTHTIELNDPTAHDLADRLPLTSLFDDFNQVEKIGRLGRALTTDGVPRGSDPEVDEIGYYAPSRDLVFHYGDVGYFNGIVRIGRFNTGIDLIRDQPDGFSVTVDRA